MTDQPDTGALSVDDAVALLAAEPEAPKEPEAKAAPVEAAPEPEEIAASPEAEEPAEAPETASEDGGEGTEAASAVDAPHFWAAEHKDAFSKLPPELQAIVRQHEDSRVTASNKAIQEAREAQKRADEAVQQAADKSAKLGAQVETWEQRFASKWPETVDWVATLNQCVEQFGAEQGTVQYQRLRAEHDADQNAIAAAKAAKQQADQESRAAFAKRETEHLRTIEPELVDPKHGPERVRQLNAFLAERGIPPDQLANAGAIELSLAYDAMRYRQGQTKAKEALKPQPQPVPGKTVAPAAGKPVHSQQQRAVEQANGRFHAKPTLDNAAAAILARG